MFIISKLRKGYRSSRALVLLTFSTPAPPPCVYQSYNPNYGIRLVSIYGYYKWGGLITYNIVILEVFRIYKIIIVSPPRSARTRAFLTERITRATCSDKDHIRDGLPRHIVSGVIGYIFYTIHT